MIFIYLLRLVNFGRVTPTAHDGNYCWLVTFPSSTHRPGHTYPTLFEQCAGSLASFRIYMCVCVGAKSNRLQVPL